MSLVEPYSPCPCGSGQKYKWCCQKVEAYAERAQRLLENGQYEAALVPLDEGLAKVPDSAWLLTRKAVTHLHLGQVEDAKGALRALLAKHPDNLSGVVLSTRLALETEGLAAGIAQFQQGLAAARSDDRPRLASLAAFIGAALNRGGFPAAAIKHLELAVRLGPDGETHAARPLAALKASEVSLWEKNPYRLWPAPEGVSAQFRDSFNRALAWADEGLWSSAAAAFELLAAGSAAGAVADRNRGLCCLWIADHEAAFAALRRYIQRSGPTLDAIDLEGLCQRIGKVPPRDLVDFVHLTWAIRNREGLLAALRAEKAVAETAKRPLDPGDPKSPEVERFLLLDRPRTAAREGLKRVDIPVIQGEVLISGDSVILEAHDDGRLDKLTDRFTTLAGLNIPPAHPRTRVLRKEPRYHLTLGWRWLVPDETTPEDQARLHHEQMAYVLREVWPHTPHPFLRWRTPLQAARAGDAETSLRAAICLLELAPESERGLVDWNELRSQLELKPERELDPQEVDIDALHIARLRSVPVDGLDDDRLIALYHRADEWAVRPVVNRVARIMDARPSLIIKGRIDSVALYGGLAIDAAHNDDRSQAEMWLARGRQAESSHKRSAHALSWELLDVEVHMLVSEPDVWVPRIAVLLEKYQRNQEATSAIFIRLVNLGLVQLARDPKNPEQVLLDTRGLETLLATYGPRVTTAAGNLGAGGTAAPIWTPGSTAEPGKIWTPGSAASRSPERESAKIIMPGQ
jgi:tetratricopeptide (TPR) repeat protein